LAPGNCHAAHERLSRPAHGVTIATVSTRAAAVLVTLVTLGLLADAGPARQTTFPGPNGQLAYTLSQLYVVNPDGSGKRAVTTSTPAKPVRATAPAWSPDGSRIAFANTVGTTVGGGIWIINSDGTGGTRVPSTEQNDRSPTWSPDGRRIAFVRAAGRFNSLFVVNTDGTGLRQVTTDITADDPEWSPDGTRFAFGGGPGSDVWVANADGSGRRNLTANEVSNAGDPSWSPDGSRIAYAVLNAVRVVPAAGGASSQLVGGLREVWEVSWSPDGNQIAFVNDRGGPLQEELYVANADGSNARPINVDTEASVDWGRASTAPVVGVSVNIAPVSGTVLVRVRGTQKFVSLAQLRNVPVGSELDTTRGRVRLVSAAGKKKTQTGVFYSGRAVVRQNKAKTPVTTLQVSGPLNCSKRSFATTAKPKKKRRLWGNAKGRFATKGGFSTASVRGTVWLTEDSCDGTLVRVVRGRVEVLDRVLHRRVIVTTGHSYFARAHR
jgi:dipeptidyl aminopeptidase/acylaminoacyl peptidase